MKSEPTSLGDCIDCTLCVQVCPTGIDIRNGILNEMGKELPLRFEVENVDGAVVRFIGNPPLAIPGDVTEGAVFIDLPATLPADFTGKLQISIWTGGG